MPLHVQFKQWLWEEFWQRDLRRYVGRGLASHHCAAGGAGLKTPWELGTFYGSDEAAE